MPSIKEVVAENLRRLCAADGRPMAVLCKEMGLPRTQFDRYLSAENLPTEGTVQTIARFFKVREVDIFQIGFRGKASFRPKQMQKAMDSLMHNPAPRIPEGQYFAFFRVQTSPEEIMCSAIAVRKEGGNLVFARLTGYSKHLSSASSFFRGRHTGVVVERSNWLYFDGVNTIADYEPSMMMVRWISSDEMLLPGKAIITTELGPSIVDVVVKKASADLSLLAAARMSRMYSWDAQHIGPDVVRLLRKSPSVWKEEFSQRQPVNHW